MKQTILLEHTNAFITDDSHERTGNTSWPYPPAECPHLGMWFTVDITIGNPDSNEPQIGIAPIPEGKSALYDPLNNILICQLCGTTLTRIHRLLEPGQLSQLLQSLDPPTTPLAK